MQNCFIFQLEGENTIEYDLLDNIEKCKDAHEGYLVFPEQTLMRSMRESQKEEKQDEEELDPIAQVVQGKEKEVLMAGLPQQHSLQQEVWF